MNAVTVLNNSFNYLKSFVSTNCYSVMKETLTKQQKIILTVALAIFSSLAIGLSYYYLKTKRVEQRNKLPPGFYNLHQEQPGDQLKQVDQSLVKESIGKKAIKKIEIDDIWLSIFKFADLGNWCHLSQTNRQLSQLAKHSIICARLLNSGDIPSVKVLEFVKRANSSVLHTLDLSNVIFKDSQELEQTFKVFSKLQHVSLSLSRNSKDLITDELLQKLPVGLEFLQLDGFKLDGLPTITNDGIENLPRGLQSLQLVHCNEITNVGLKKLPPKLRSLDLHYCESLTIANDELEKLPSSLTSLSLKQIDFTGIKIKFPQKLGFLDLSFCNITNEEVKGLRFFNLISLNLRGCRNITNEGLEELPNDLRSLNLDSCLRITDAIIEKFPRNLTSLDLSFCRITDVGIAHLPPALVYFTYLTFSGSREITAKGIAKLPATLRSFEFSSYFKMEEVIMKSLPRGLTSLKLVISGIDQGIGVAARLASAQNLTGLIAKDESILDQLPNGLTSLKLDLGDFVIKDVHLEKLPRALKKLTLYHCQEITSAGIKQLPKGLISLTLHEFNAQDGDLEYLPSDLTSLDLPKCDITDQGIEKFSPKLKILILGNCEKITNEGIKKFHQGLKELTLGNCTQLTDEGIKHFPAGLRVLALTKANQITNDGMEKLPTGLTTLAIENCLNITKGLKMELQSKGIRAEVFA